jgi:hypothetical protein
MKQILRNQHFDGAPGGARAYQSFLNAVRVPQQLPLSLFPASNE